MTKNTTAAAEQPDTLAALGRLVQVDPRELEVDPHNARKAQQNAKPDAALLASVAEIGVQEPITVRPLEGGKFGVFKGQRRWLAALDAAKKAAAKGKPVRLIPAFVREDLAGADHETLLLSLVENTQRARMTERDTISGAAQLELIGTTEADRRRAARILGLKRDALKAARKAADMSTEALAEGSRYGFDMIELADLAEVEELPRAAYELHAAKRSDEKEGKKQRGHWQHTMSQLRQRLAEQRERTAAEERLTKAGVKVLARWRSMDAPDRPLAALTTTQGEEITAEAHAKCKGHAARLDDECKPVWHCADPGRFGHVVTGQIKDAETTATEKARRREVIEKNRAARAAREVRKEFITELCRRKSVSEAGWELVLAAVLNTPYVMRTFTNKTAEKRNVDVSRFTRAAGPEGKDEPFTELIKRTGKARRAQLLLAYVAAAYEAEMHDRAWEHPQGTPHTWLVFLQGEGYTLSAHESAIVAKAEGRAEEQDEEPAGLDGAHEAEDQAADEEPGSEPQADEEAAPEEAAAEPAEGAQRAEGDAGAARLTGAGR